MSHKPLKDALSYATIVLITFGLLLTKVQPQGIRPATGFAGTGQPSSPSVTWVIYQQPAGLIGGLIPSSWWDPNGSASDRTVWDDFTFQASKDITEVHWVGGYDPSLFGSGGPVLDFTVAFYPSNTAGQPDLINPPIVSYQTGGNAGQTPAGTIGIIPMYKYAFVLPVPFTAAAGTRYWVEIYAWQNGLPDWGLAYGSGGDNVYYFRIHGNADYYQFRPGDAAFSLLGPVNVKSVYVPLIIR